MQGKETKKNHFLDLLKGIACIGVVFGHALFPGQFGYVVLTAATGMVPIFFLISGYYSYQASQEKLLLKTKRKEKHIARITGGVLGLYLLWMLLRVLLRKKAVSTILHVINVRSAVKFFVLNDTTMFDGGHLWFLLALLYCYIALYIIGRFQLMKFTYPVIAIAFVLRIFAVSCGNWHYSQNFWVDGFPYFFLGFYLREHSERYAKVKSNLCVGLAIGGFLFSEIANMGGVFPFRLNIYEIGTILMAISLFVYAIKNPEIGENSFLEKIGRNYSMFVYIVHVIVLQAITDYEGIILKSIPTWYLWIKPILVVCLTLLLAMLFDKIKGKMKFRIVKVS